MERARQGRADRALIVSKWIGFVAAIWVQAIAGNNYTFANYSQALKKVMNLNQKELNNLSFAKDVGKSFGVVSGLAMDLLPPWMMLAIGSVQGLIGYGAQWLVVSERISPLPYWQMCIFMCFGGNSTTWMNTACLVTCLRNFPTSRGTVIGILKGFVSLSTALFTVLCTSLFTSDPGSFLLLLSILPAVICVSGMIFLKPVPPSHVAAEGELEEKNFTFLNVISVVIAVYLFAFTILADIFNFYPLVYKIYSVVLLLLLASPLVFPLSLLLLSYLGQEKPKSVTEARDETKQPLLADADWVQPKADIEEEEPLQLAVSDPAHGGEVVNGAHSGAEETPTRPKLGQDFTILEATANLDFWLLFFTFLCGIGTGITAINNLGQIADALGYSEAGIFVSLVSIMGFFARLGAGGISEHYVKSRALPRTVWIVISHAVMLLGYVYWASGLPGSMYICSAIVGACYGVHIAISVPVASELFGLKNFGMLYNILILNIPLGSFLFSGLLAGWLYDVEAEKQSNKLGGWVMGMLGLYSSSSLMDGDTEALTCTGAHCYGTVFLVMAGTCLVGLILAIILSLRSRVVYNTLYGTRGTLVAHRH